MATVDYYTDNVYTNEYYLVQYILTTVCIRKKYCYMILTEDECSILKEYIPELTIRKFHYCIESNTTTYEIYKE